MKQRLTYLSPEGSDLDATSIKVDSDGLNYTNAANAAGIEQRITLSLDELPTRGGELAARAVLKDVHELHIRWTTPSNNALPVPLISRLPAGLHVFYTPRQGKDGRHICRALKNYFGPALKCDSVSNTFSSPSIQSERFASVASYQYHHQLDDIRHFVARTGLDACPRNLDAAVHEECLTRIATLSSVCQLDIDYDAISHALVVRAVWSNRDTWNAASRLRLPRVKLSDADGTIEVGVLAPEKADEPDELKLGGFLTVLADDAKPSPTLFSFPSRHHPLLLDDDATFETEYLLPTGLHPTLAIKFKGNSLRPPDESCALHAYLTLPSALFLDKYQLSDPALLASNHLRALRSLSGADDLEAPDWAVKQWGSAALLELQHPTDPGADKTWQVQIPTHLRYLQATNETQDRSSRTIIASWPIVFWACQAEEGLKMNTNPFDRVNLGYDGLFGPKTMFYHIPPHGDSLTSEITVPVLDPATTSWLPQATLSVVIMGLAWVLWSLLGPLPRKSHEKKD